MTSNKPRQKKWSINEKQAIVKESFDGDLTVRQLAKKIKINVSTLTRWRRKYRDGGFFVQNTYQPKSQGLKRRSWTKSEKEQVVNESYQLGVTKTGQKYELSNANIYRWRAHFPHPKEDVSPKRGGIPVVARMTNYVDRVPIKSVMAKVYAVGDIRVLLELYKFAREDGHPHNEVLAGIIDNVRWGCNYLNHRENKGDGE